MARVTFACDYRAELQTGGDGRIVRIAARAGETVELDEAQIEFVRRDCPDALVEDKPKAAPTTSVEPEATASEPEARAPEAPAFDRQIKRGARRGV